MDPADAQFFQGLGSVTAFAAQPESPHQRRYNRKSRDGNPEPTRNHPLCSGERRRRSCGVLDYRRRGGSRVADRDLAHEPVTLARDRLNEARIVSVIAERAPNLAYGMHEGIFSDEVSFQTASSKSCFSIVRPLFSAKNIRVSRGFEVRRTRS
jgi:hypothetical protein